jgi:hypothetical protein
MKTVPLIVPLAAAALGLALASTPASATLSTRSIMQQASGICGANNPANDVYLRRLPTGLKSAGASNISVVCSLWGDDGSTQAASAAWVYIKNEKAVGANVYCTLAMGVPEYSQVTVTRTVYVPAGATSAVFWDTTAYGTSIDKQWVNLQCALPPGWSMTEIGMTYDENVGT